MLFQAQGATVDVVLETIRLTTELKKTHRPSFEYHPDSYHFQAMEEYFMGIGEDSDLASIDVSFCAQ